MEGVILAGYGNWLRHFVFTCAVYRLGCPSASGQETQATEKTLSSSLAVQVCYVAPDGKPTGDGSLRRPWPSVEYAFGRMGSGQTIVMRPGLYPGPIRVPLIAAGQPGHPTVIRSERKWEAIIVGGAGHGIYTDEGCSWVEFDGLRISGALYSGIRIQGHHCTVRNCWIHNCASHGISAHNRDGTVIEQCVIEYNGHRPRWEHGIYADGRGLRVCSNIVRHNSGCGIHLYPAASLALVAHNLVYGHTDSHSVIVQGAAGVKGSVIAFNTVTESYSAIQVFGGVDNVIANNIAVGKSAGVYTRDTKSSVVEGNLIRVDRGFVDPEKHVYWLKADSPARGAARSGELFRASPIPWEEVVGRDFFGAVEERDDVGAFEYRKSLEGPDARSKWFRGWPYETAQVNEKGMPDFWVLPPAAGD